MKVLYGVKDPWYLHDLRTEQTFWGSVTYKVKWKRLMKKYKHVHKNILHNKKHGHSIKNLTLKEATILEKFNQLREMYLDKDLESKYNEYKRSEQIDIQNLLNRCMMNVMYTMHETLETK